MIYNQVEKDIVSTKIQKCFKALDGQEQNKVIVFLVIIMYRLLLSLVVKEVLSPKVIEYIIEG